MKKRNLVLLLALLLPMLSHAQLEKGMRNFEENSQYLVPLSDGTSGFLGIFSNQQGWMVSDNILLGTDYGGGLISGGGETNPLIVGGPFIRYYFNPTSTNLNFFLNADTDFLIFLDDDLDGNLTIELSAGVNKFLKPDFALRGQVGFQFIDDSEEAVFFIGADIENFINQESWKNRRSTTDPSAKGSFLLGNPDFRINFIPDFNNVLVLNTGLGYFVSDDFAVGLDIGLNDTGNFTSIRLVPYLRYYLSKARTSWFLQAEAGPNINSFTTFFGNSITETTWEFFAGAGFNKFLSPNVAIEAQIGIFDNPINLGITSLAASFGMQYYIHR